MQQLFIDNILEHKALDRGFELPASYRFTNSQSNEDQKDIILSASKDYTDYLTPVPSVCKWND